MDERLERAPYGVLDVASDGTIEAANDAARRLLAVGDDPVVGGDLGTAFPHSVARTVPGAFDGSGPPSEREVEEYYPDLDRWLAVSIVPVEDGATVYLRDVSDRRDAERTADRLRGELERLEIIDGLIAAVLSELVGATTREEIAETICERLGSTDLYEFAWVGERDVGGEGVAVRAAAGATGRTLDQVRDALGGASTTPEERAMETGTVQVVQPLAEAQSVAEAIRRAAFADGIQSAIAIPLTYGSSVYGVVGVYASGQEAFSDRERASFETLGEMAGFAVNATRHRNLLLSDTVVEVTFQVRDPADPVLSAASDPDATLSLQGTIPREEAGLICYLAVDGADPGAVAAGLDDVGGASGSRVVRDGTDAGLVEAEIDGETPLGVLAAQGVTIRSAVYEDGTGRIVAELPPDEEVRRVADAVTRRLDAEVVAKRERERSVLTAREFRDELRERLTEKQETALRTAFFADYFESPRGSNAEEVASVLGVTGPTLLYHLRAGQRKLLDEFFQDDPDTEPGIEDR